MIRWLRNYKMLFVEYERIDDEQIDLYEKKILLPDDKKNKFNELQVKKIAIIEEMEKQLI